MSADPAIRAEIEAIPAEARARIAAMPLMTLADHVEVLGELVTCRCDPAYSQRDLIDPACHHDYRQNFAAVRAALVAADLIAFEVATTSADGPAGS